MSEDGDEATRARARRTEAAPSAKEVVEHNLDHVVFRVGVCIAPRGERRHTAVWPQEARRREEAGGSEEEQHEEQDMLVLVRKDT